MTTTATKKSLILGQNSTILRKKAKTVTLKEIESKSFQNILKKMKTALHGEEDGVAIAAPQIGESLRIFIVSGRILNIIKKLPRETKPQKDLIFINPEFIKVSKKKNRVEEGCLSVRWLYGWVNRSEKVVMRAHDEHGKKIERGASGLLAQIFQHEVDHLNGVLFIDKAENIQDLPPPEIHK